MHNAIPLIVAALIAVGIIVIGCFYLASPERISGSFGLKPPASDADTRAWLRPKGIRDVLAGLVVLTMMLTADRRLVGITLLVEAIIPLGDMSIILGSGIKFFPQNFVRRFCLFFREPLCTNVPRSGSGSVSFSSLGSSQPVPGRVVCVGFYYFSVEIRDRYDLRLCVIGVCDRRRIWLSNLAQSTLGIIGVRQRCSEIRSDTGHEMACRPGSIIEVQMSNTFSVNTCEYFG
jgi:Domain of unknown function (DUF4267)